MVALEGGSVGLQIGGQATDFVLLLMSPRSAESVLSTKVKLGADASAAAGPKGRDASAETDAAMRAEILSYSRSRPRCFRRHFPGRLNAAPGQRWPMSNSMAVNTLRRTSSSRVSSRPARSRKLLATLNKKSPKSNSAD